MLSEFLRFSLRATGEYQFSVNISAARSWMMLLRASFIPPGDNPRVPYKRRVCVALSGAVFGVP